MPDTVLTLTLDCDCPLIESALPSQRLVEVVVEAAKPTGAPDRAGLNVALVIDRSGSMSGDKLRYAQEAACHVLDRLDGRDRVAVVAYDDEIRTLSPSVVLSDGTRAELKRQINALQPGGTTDLGGGWLRGAEEVSQHFQAQTVNRVLLLTDGLANVGIVGIEPLSHHARELARRGVTLSTFGVGEDYDHDLLEAMANEGGGHYYFIEHPREISGLFGRELGELLTVVARETTLTVPIPAGVAVELLGDLSHEASPERLRLFLRDVFAGERRCFYLKTLTPPGTLGARVGLRAELSYAALDGQTQSARAEAVFMYAASAQGQARNTPLQERAGEVEVAAAATRALKLEQEGRSKEAAAFMRRAVAAAPALPAAMACAYEEQAEEMANGLSPQQRKTQHAAAYKTRNTRK